MTDEPTTSAAVCSCGARTKPHPKGETPCMYLAPGQPVYETTTAACDVAGITSDPCTVGAT